MNYQIVRNIIGKLMILLAFLMCIPLIVCIVYQEEFINYVAFLVPIGLLLIIGVLFNLKKADNKKMMVREGFIIVGVSWLIMSLFGCIPYIISGVLPNPFDAFFEITSGFTTTGATVMGGLNTITPEQITAGSHSKVWWICSKCNHTYDEPIDSFNVSIELVGTSSSTMNGYGSFSKNYKICLFLRKIIIFRAHI